jgi:hypothetical protein
MYTRILKTFGTIYKDVKVYVLSPHLRAFTKSRLAPGTTVRACSPTESILAAAVPKLGAQTRLRSRAGAVSVLANLLIGTGRLVQLDGVKQPVRVLECVGVSRREGAARAFDTAARRHGLPRAVVDHGAAKVGVDDDCLLLEVVPDAAAPVGRLEVGRGRAPALRVGGPAGQVGGHRGPGPRPDAQAVVLDVGGVYAASCCVESVAV